MNKTRRIIIAIDGPAGSGKSSTAKKVAEKLDYFFLDSGAMYRVITLNVLNHNIDPKNADKVLDIAQKSDFEILSKNGQHVLLNKIDVTQEIRTPLVTQNISPVAAHPGVRQILVKKQRQYAKGGGIVAEGRDIGTVVFPDAQLKIYMIASIEARAQRRYQELAENGVKIDINELKRTIEERDKGDRQRLHGALFKAQDAILLDTSNMTFDEQVNFIVEKAHERGA